MKLEAKFGIEKICRYFAFFAVEEEARDEAFDQVIGMCSASEASWMAGSLTVGACVDWAATEPSRNGMRSKKQIDCKM